MNRFLRKFRNDHEFAAFVSLTKRQIGLRLTHHVHGAGALLSVIKEHLNGVAGTADPCVADALVTKLRS